MHDFQEMSGFLKASCPGCPEMDLTVSAYEEAVFQYLEQVFAFLGEDLLNVAALVAFLDNMSVSRMTELQMKYLRKQVCIHRFLLLRV